VGKYKVFITTMKTSMKTRQRRKTMPEKTIIALPKGSVGRWSTIKISGRNIGHNTQQRDLLPVVVVECWDGQRIEGHEFVATNEFGLAVRSRYDEAKPLPGMVQFWLESTEAVLRETESGADCTAAGEGDHPVRVYVNKMRVTPRPPYRPALAATWGKHYEHLEHSFEVEYGRTTLFHRPHEPLPDGSVLWLQTTADLCVAQWSARPDHWARPEGECR
jgi:hypothetical protein